MRKRRWLGLALAAAILLLANAGVSGALELGWARRTLLARLAASFGRPVEVGRFQFSVLSGLRLEADSVTVAEDPRFGQEYFLRAEQLTAGLRWTALLRGRIEFGIVSLSRPSLNLVRLPDGSWNIESWLPPANQPFPVAGAVPTDAGAPPGPAGSPALNLGGRVAARLSRLDVNGGRINFKLSAEKLPFALVNVNGDLEQDNSGRWSIDLEANPMRAPIVLQNAGTLRLEGTVAGTTARLRPAAFALSWEDASLADALRLADGTDHGVRGALSAQLSATIANPPEVPSIAARSIAPPSIAKGPGSASSQWNLQGTLRLSGVHRWDMGESPLDPAINAILAADWRPGEPRLEVTRCVVEAPGSRLNATGSLDWSHGFDPNVQLASSRIGLGDLLAWRRAFLPGIADDLSVEGAVTLDASLAGWPPRLGQASAASNGAVVRMQALPGPLRIGRVEASLERGVLVFGSVPVSLPGVRAPTRNAPEPGPVGALQIAGGLGPVRPGDSPRDWRYRLDVSGDTQRAQDLIALAGVFGRPTNADWSVKGPVALNLAWTGALHRGTSAANGTLELRGLQLSSVALSQPFVVGSASVVLKGDERDVRLVAVRALGAHWTGSLRRRSAAGPWDFDLSADRLDPAEVDRWLVPGGQPGLLGRILPFTVSRSSAPAREAVFARLAARGRLRVGEVLLAPLAIAKLDADAEIDGRRIVLRRAQADFYGGRLSGELNASLAAEPFYSFRGRVDRVDLGLLANASAPLAGRFAGLAAGELTLEARGIGREPLAASLEGEGVLRVRNAVVRGLDLGAALGSERGPDQSPLQRLPAPGRAGDSELGLETRYGTAEATFHIADGRVLMNQVLLVGRDEQLEIDGTVNFARQLNLRVRPLSRDLTSRDLTPRDLARTTEIDPQDSDADTWAIAGTLEAPQIRLQTPVAGASAPAVSTRARR